MTTHDLDLREQHDIHRKALADALTGLPGQRWDLSWDQIIDLAEHQGDFANGGVNDIRELYRLHDAIEASGGTLNGPVNRAIDALRARWDQSLRRAQERPSV